MGADFDPVTFTRKVQKHFSRVAQSYHQAAEVQRQMAHRLVQLLPASQPPVKHLFEMGAGTGILTKELDQRLQVAHYTLNDLCKELLQQVPPLQDPQPTWAVGDASTWCYDNRQIDFFASASALQWLPRPLLFLANLYHQILPGGTMLIATYGPNNLQELRSLTGQGLSYASLLEYKQLFASFPDARFELREETIVTWHRSPLLMLKSLQNTGVTALPSSSQPVFTSKTQVEQFAKQYAEQFQSQSGQVKLSYHAIYLWVQKGL